MGAQLSYPAVDLSGKVAVVTGANTGIGYEIAKALAAMGAHTIVACRSQQRAEEALARLRQELAVEVPEREVKVDFMPLDLSSFLKTQQFVTAFKERNLPLHILINNAGIALVPQGRTNDGYELHFQVNHLSHFLLTLELLPSLLETAGSTGDGRIVFVSSSAHRQGSVDPNNMNGEQSYGRGHFYGNSKLYNVMTALALQRRLQQTGITVSSLHPGLTKSEVYRGLAGENRPLLWLGSVVSATFRSTKGGAATAINCAVNPALNTQQSVYYEDCKPCNPAPLSRDKAVQEQLWEISVSIVKEFLSLQVLAKYGEPMPAELADQTSDPVHRPTSGPTEQSMDQPTSGPTEQVTNQPTSGPTEQVTNQPTSGPTEQSMDQPTSGPTEQVTNQPTSGPTEQSMNQPASGPTEQVTNSPEQSMDQPASGPTEQVTNSPEQSMDQPTSGPTEQACEMISD